MKIRFIAFALLLLMIAPLAVAQPAHPNPQVLLARYLQLTPDQISAWKQINQDTATAVKPLAATARDQQKQLKTAVEAATPDSAAIGKLALALHATREQIRGVRDDARSKRAAVLTADQKAKLDGFEAAMAFLKAQSRNRN